MKLTGELKKRVDQAKDREEMRSLIEEAGMELTDEELALLSGGDDEDNIIVKLPKCL